MIEVIDQQKSFVPSIFFVAIMIIGNFMLLNLFLAILLKSISEIGEKDDEAEVEGNKEDAKTKSKDTNQIEDGEGEQTIKNELQDSGQPMNSSNSNIEDEFE